MKLPWTLGFVVMLATTLVAGLRPESRAGVAEACSYAEPSIEWYADEADYVALVEVVAVGGPENNTPPVTPAPRPEFYPPVTPTPISFDLTGVSATLKVIDDAGSGAPAEFKIDELLRERTELDIRELEANPWLKPPCEIGFGVPRYELGEYYMVFAARPHGDSRLETLLKYEVEGDKVVPGRSPDGYGYQVSMKAATHQAYLADVPFEIQGEDMDGDESGRVVADSILVEQLMAAIEGVLEGTVPESSPSTGAEPTHTPAPVPPAPVLIAPPTVGDAGLR